MSNSFIENVNYVAKLDNAFGDNISLNKTNISFRGTTANVKFKLSYYDNSLMKILSVETLFNNASYTDLNSILSQFKSNVENIIGVNCNFTLSTNNNAYLVSLVNISLSSSNNDIKFVELKFEMEKDGIDLYDVYGKITNPLKILPHLALYDEIFISSIVSIDSHKNELLNVNTNISEIVAINDNIEYVISVNNNMNNINTILSNMDTIENVISSINEINNINTNIGQIHTVYENIDSILIDANNISNINIVSSDLYGRLLLNAYDAGNIHDPIDTEDLGSSSIVNVSDNINAIININNSIVPNINEILLADNNAIIATTKASEAKTSASNAMISETNASASEANALVSETNAFNSSVSALTSASKANSSELIATAKAIEASASATIAIAKASESSLSANSASASALSASESELSALSSSNTATASKDIAVAKANEASISAFNAATSEANSLTYSQNSLASANNSQNSASVSVAKASEAYSSATKSYEWANKAKDLEVEPGLYSAKHWASVAAAYFTTPLEIRHNQLRARDDVDSHPISAITGLQYELDNKVTKNANITAGTGTKITYDTKGFVIASTTLSSTDIPSLDTGKLTTGTLPVARGGTGTTTSTGSGSVVLSTSPVLTTPNIGVATGTSFNSITGLASVAPLIAGTAAVGNSTLAARQDHVHPVQTSVSGNAGTATKLETARTIALTGDVTYTSGAFDGSGNVTGTATLANSGVTAGTYKSVTVDSKGRVTGGTNPNTIALYGITDAYTKTEIGAINTDYVAVFNAALL